MLVNRRLPFGVYIHLAANSSGSTQANSNTFVKLNVGQTTLKTLDWQL